MQQPDQLPLEMMRFAQKKDVIYKWNWRTLAREVAQKMASLNLNASDFARDHLLMTPQHLCDLVSGRRKWSFELVKRLVNIKKEAK